MDSLADEGLVYRDTLTFRDLYTSTGALRWVHLRGRVECCDDVLVSVSKYLDVALNDRNQLVVKGKFYSYHAWVRGRPRRDLMRYDNGHGEADLHRHFFDESGVQIAIEPVGFDSLPRLDLIIREALAIAQGTPIDDLHRPPPSRYLL